MSHHPLNVQSNHISHVFLHVESVLLVLGRYKGTWTLGFKIKERRAVLRMEDSAQGAVAKITDHDTPK